MAWTTAAWRCAAPYKALELIARARTADLDTGTAAETDAVVDLVMSDRTAGGACTRSTSSRNGPDARSARRTSHSPGP